MNKKWGVVAVSLAACLMMYGCGQGSSTANGGAAGGNGSSTSPSQGIAVGEPAPGTSPDKPELLSVPKDVTKIEVRYKPAKPNPPTIQRTITDQAQIAKLVDALNALPKDQIGTHHCVQDYGQQATLTFYPTTGDPIVVSVVPSCNNISIGGKGLPDESGAVWNTVQQVMGDK
jgi:hypothetical protein